MPDVDDAMPAEDAIPNGDDTMPDVVDDSSTLESDHDECKHNYASSKTPHRLQSPLTRMTATRIKIHTSRTGPIEREKKKSRPGA